MSTSVSSTDSANIKDYLLDINDLNKPKVVDMTVIQPGILNSAETMICRLILLEKGLMPDHPDMGVGLVSRYTFAYTSELTTLENDITEQINQYLPEFTPVSVSVAMGETGQNQDKILYISITINQSDFTLMYNISTNTLSTL